MKIKELKFFLVNVINASNTIKNKLSIEKKEKLIEIILNLSDKTTITLFKILNEDIDVRQIKRNMDRVAGGMIFIPVPGTVVLYTIYKIISELNYNCIIKCNGSEENKKICYLKCNILSLEKAIVKVKKELADCWYDKNPKKCQKRTINYLKELYESLGKAKDKLNKNM
jgi:hypothetical protein